ncbi:TetR family transcriptional regulator [Angustibacter aerolatus]|uniref:TetR family transcriptional regulator n=1 Tax=Angustibacter aerolatus TaxID=1162965 RepID=A0ABQ6JD44_9ACTN|nr:TetR/AcrR family transcriptional regulator [Angustibacter aerolatus]GMA86100.1 TetR family transcriptional regulator [Angustibacter aerolatus]
MRASACRRLRSSLYAEQGFEQTTVADIARRVGLTERTFFRHFADKREVLFHGQDALTQAFLDGVVAAPEGSSPCRLVVSALESSTGWFPDERRAHSRQRQAVIDAHPGLQEREPAEAAALGTTLTEALRARGVGDPAARLAAEFGVTVFGVAFTQWLADGEERSMGEPADRRAARASAP